MKNIKTKLLIMSSFIYNPNIDVDYDKSYDTDDSVAINFPADGNFRQNTRTDSRSEQFDHDKPRSEQFDHDRGSERNTRQRTRRVKFSEPLVNESAGTEHLSGSKLNWVLLFKKIVIYSVLFLVMSHIKMNQLVCNFIPLVNNNEVACMSMKGVIMAVIIIVIQNILN